jgi:hypothetical protein
MLLIMRIDHSPGEAPTLHILPPTHRADSSVHVRPQSVRSAAAPYHPWLVPLKTRQPRRGTEYPCTTHTIDTRARTVILPQRQKGQVTFIGAVTTGGMHEALTAYSRGAAYR